jgi:hypothetical protein
VLVLIFIFLTPLAVITPLVEALLSISTFLLFVTTLAVVVFAAFLVVLMAAPTLTACIAALFAAAARPGDHLYFSDRRHRVIARDHQFTGSWLLLRSLIANHDI